MLNLTNEIKLKKWLNYTSKISFFFQIVENS